MNNIIRNLFNKLMTEKINRLGLELIKLEETGQPITEQCKLEGKLEGYHEICLLLSEVLR